LSGHQSLLRDAASARHDDLSNWARRSPSPSFASVVRIWASKSVSAITGSKIFLWGGCLWTTGRLGTMHRHGHTDNASAALGLLGV